MARKYARTKLSINDDPDFEALSTEAQWLYQRVMLTDPTLSACGVMDWRPKRLLRKSRTITLQKLLAAAAELEKARFALFDLTYEEALVRTYVRHDEPLKNPRMAAPVVTSYQAATSPELRAAVVTEVIREHEEHPEYSSWDHKDTADDLARMMTRPNASQVGYTYAYSDFITDGDEVEIADRIGYPDSVLDGDGGLVENGEAVLVENGVPNPGSDTYSDSVHIPVPDRSGTYLHLPPTTGHLPGGHPTGVRHQGTAPDSNDPPPIGCPQHPGGTTAPCGPCREQREAREGFEAKAARLQAEQRAAARRQVAEDKARAAANCGMCDAEGYVGRSLCDHDPHAVERDRRGLAAAKIAACRMCDGVGLRADSSACDHKPPRKGAPSVARDAPDVNQSPLGPIPRDSEPTSPQQSTPEINSEPQENIHA